MCEKSKSKTTFLIVYYLKCAQYSLIPCQERWDKAKALTMACLWESKYPGSLNFPKLSSTNPFLLTVHQPCFGFYAINSNMPTCYCFGYPLDIYFSSQFLNGLCSLLSLMSLFNHSLLQRLPRKNLLAPTYSP